MDDNRLEYYKIILISKQKNSIIIQEDVVQESEILLVDRDSEITDIHADADEIIKNG